MLDNEAGKGLPEGALGARKIRRPLWLPIQVIRDGSHNPHLDLPLPGTPNMEARRVMIQGRESALQPRDGKGMDPSQSSVIPPT